MYVVNAYNHVVYDIVFSDSIGTDSLEAGSYVGDLLIHAFYLWPETYSRKGWVLDQDFTPGKWVRLIIINYSLAIISEFQSSEPTTSDSPVGFLLHARGSWNKVRDHLFSTCPKFSEKLPFCTPWYAQNRVHIRG